MAGMLPPMIRTRQPQQATGISAYWRSKGLVFVHNPALGEVNLADNRGAINTTGFPVDVGIAGRRINAAGASKSEFTDNGLASSGNSLTLISIWRSKDSQYASGDASRFLLSTRTAGNAGWGWGRSSAIAGGATGNLTGQTFVLNGVAQYSEANSTIESLVDTVVAMRVNGTTASWFRFGKKSSTDTTVGTASTGATAIFGAGGPYSGAANIWNDRAYLTLAFNKPLSDADIFALCKDVNSPWQVFAPIQRQIFAAVAGGAGSQTLTPTLYGNTHTFYGPTLIPGAATLTPSLYSNSPAFYSPTVSIAGGPQQLTASRVDNVSVFYSPLLSPGAVTLAPSLYNHTQTFYSLTLSASKTLSAALFANSPTFYSPIVSLGSGPQVVAPGLFTNAQSYFTQMVAPGQVSLFPLRLTNSPAFYAATVSDGSTGIPDAATRYTVTAHRHPLSITATPRSYQVIK
jgi:hypothetical protein